MDEARHMPAADGDDAMRRHRAEIDRIDVEIVRLLGERSRLAIDIGRLKRGRQLPLYDPDREEAVIAAVTACNPGPLDSAAVRRLFERIIDESRRLERETIEREEPPGSGSEERQQP